MERRRCVYLVACIAVVAFINHTSHGFKVELPVEEGVQCTRPGLMCEDCAVSNLCYQQSNGSWVKEFVEDCTLTQQTCRESTGTCTTEINEPCTSVVDVDFQCHDVGIFPDPYNCTEFHICVRGPNDTFVRSTEFCADGVYFDPLTSRCTLKNSAGCPQPVPTCRQVSQGPVRGNPRMYYICLPSITPSGQRVYSPSLYNCPGPLIYLRGECFDSTTPLGIVNNTCTMKGDLYLPMCNQFYTCNSVGVAPVFRTCPSGSFFNTTSEVCQPYDCSVLLPK